jgi:hypothetical protein
MNTRENANATNHYLILTVAIIIGVVGVFFRFLGDSFLFTSISNVILIVGILIALRTVFAIIK